MRVFLTAVVALALAGGSGARQPPPAFDAVSIKVNRSGEQGGSSRAQPGRYVGVNVTLMRLVRLAYRPVEEFDGGPDWKEKDRFDIEAVTAANASQPQMLAMLRTLLTDRFKLRAHTETRALPVYELSLGRPDGRLGSSLTRVADACPPPVPPAAQPGAPGPAPVRCGFQVGDGVLKGMGTLANIASELVVAGRHTVDRTGLAGVYRIDLRPTGRPGMRRPALRRRPSLPLHSPRAPAGQWWRPRQSSARRRRRGS